MLYSVHNSNPDFCCTKSEDILHLHLQVLQLQTASVCKQHCSKTDRVTLVLWLYDQLWQATVVIKALEVTGLTQRPFHFHITASEVTTVWRYRNSIIIIIIIMFIHTYTPVIKQYNLVPANGRWQPAVGKVTIW